MLSAGELAAGVVAADPVQAGGAAGGVVAAGAVILDQVERPHRPGLRVGAAQPPEVGRVGAPQRRRGGDGGHVARRVPRHRRRPAGTAGPAGGSGRPPACRSAARRRRSPSRPRTRSRGWSPPNWRSRSGSRCGRYECSPGSRARTCSGRTGPRSACRPRGRPGVGVVRVARGLPGGDGRRGALALGGSGPPLSAGSVVWSLSKLPGSGSVAGKPPAVIAGHWNASGGVLP